MKCDVCGKETEIYVRASSMGAISLAYCKDCLNKGLEPYGIMVAYISCAGKFPEDINEKYQAHVRYILKELNISEEKFIKDVNESIVDMEKYYSQPDIAEEFEEAKHEVLSIVDDALKLLEKDSADNLYCCNNGSLWSYDEVREFLKKNINRIE